MIPVPPNCQEIPGVILTLPNGHWLTPDGRETANFTERGVWDDEATSQSFIDLLFREEPDAIAVAQTESAARDLPQLSNYMETPTHTAPPVASHTLFGFDCQSCGACCAYSDTWPEVGFDEEIPDELLDDSGERMACTEDRCDALRGIVGKRVKCNIYANRPTVCRTCQPGDKSCQQARRYFSLPNDLAHTRRAGD